MTLGGFLFIVLFLALSAWVFIAVIRQLRREHANVRWWTVFALLIAGGTALGVWCGFYAEYPAGSQFRIFGFPIPVGFLHWEDGRWVDFPVPAVQGLLSAITNVFAIAAFAVLPVWVASRRRQRRERVSLGE